MMMSRDRRVTSKQCFSIRKATLYYNFFSVHLQNIYETDELKKEATTEKISVVRREGNRLVVILVIFPTIPANGKWCHWDSLGFGLWGRRCS